MKRAMGTAALMAVGVWLTAGWGLAQQTPSGAGTTGTEATGTPSTQHRQPGFGTRGAAMLSAADRRFMMEAARGGMAEVKHGQLAAQRASSDAVKQFAQRMVQDHGKANSELMQLASQKGVTLPKQMGAEHMAVHNRLSRLSGAQFDRVYMQHQVRDHRKTVSLFQREANRGRDPDVKSWAAKTLPTLREHWQMARDLAAQTARGMAGRNTGTTGHTGSTGTSGTGTSGTGNKGSASPR